MFGYRLRATAAQRGTMALEVAWNMVVLLAALYSFTFTGDVSLTNTQTIDSPGACTVHITGNVATAPWRTQWSNVTLQPRGSKRTFSTTAVSFSAVSNDSQVVEACNGQQMVKNTCTGHAASDGSSARLTVTPDPRNPRMFTIDIAALGGVKDDPHCNTGVYAGALRTVITILAPSSRGAGESLSVSSGATGSKAFQPSADCSSEHGDLKITCKLTMGWTGTVSIVRTK
jgi:hypothetical protein